MNHVDPNFPAAPAPTARQAKQLSTALRNFLNAAAAIGPDEDAIAALVGDLDRLTERLAPTAVPEQDALWRKAARNEPSALLPAFDFRIAEDRLEGTVRFGRFHIGWRAVHGGAISLIFDDILGALTAHGGRSAARTAYLHVDYRAPVPIDTDLQLSAWYVLEEGRKRIARAQITNGDVICAEAEGLWIVLRPGQL